jgi:predicted phosphodiesterase
MKIALLTDTHAGCRNDSAVFNNYFLRFYKEVFFPYLDDNKINTIIHLGDVFDRRKYINFATLSSWRKNVFEVMSNKYTTIIIQGNHDIYYKSTNEVNSIEEVFRGYKNIININEPKEVEFGAANILMVPWIHPANEANCKQAMQDSTAKILFGHFDIIGFEMHRGISNYENGFSANDFLKFDTVVSGHYHHKSENSNIHYLGAPYEMIWSDFGDEKGFHVFDTNTKQLEFIPNPLHIFQKVYYNDTNKKYEDLVIQQEVVKKDENGNNTAHYHNNLEKYRDSYVKVVIEQKNNQSLFDQYLEALYKENPADVTIVEATLESVSDLDVLDETKDTLTLLIEYVEGLGIAEDNKKPLVDELKSLYMESQNIDV